jgi:hypothetical protein
MKWLFLCFSQAKRRQLRGIKMLGTRSSLVDGIISHQGTWTPQKADITELEANVTQVSRLQIEGFTFAAQIAHTGRKAQTGGSPFTKPH